MSSKFDLPDIGVRSSTTPSAEPDIATRIANFKPTVPRRIDVAAVDAAAAPHGFVSREPTPRKRRRVAPREPRPNNMGIRLSDAEKDRFIAFADNYSLPNYSEVIVRLLDIAEGKI
jgi:hypothetical protein